MTKPAKPSRKNARAANVPATQRSLAQLLYEKGAAPTEPLGSLTAIPIGKIVENNANARRTYDKDELDALARSMRENGLLEPILVRTQPKGHYELIAGSRRVRAAKILGWDTIGAILRDDVTEAGVRSASAVENLQRANLSPYEEALAYQSLIENALTQEQVAQACGVGVTTVKNRLNLLRLPKDLGERIGHDGFTQEHATVLVPLADDPKALEKVTPLIGQKHNHHNRPLLVDEFRDEVVRTLKKSGNILDAGDWSFSELKASSKPVRDAAKTAPKISFGGHHKTGLVVATPELKTAVRDAKEKRRARQAKAYGGNGQQDWKAQQAKREAEERIEKDALARLWAKVPGAVKERLDLGPEGLALLGYVTFGEYGMRDKAKLEILSQASGLSTAECQKLGGANRLPAIESLAKKDHAALGRFLMAHALLEATSMTYQMDKHDPLLEKWLKTTWKDAKSQARHLHAADARVSGKKGKDAGTPPEADAAPASMKDPEGAEDEEAEVEA